MTKIRPARINDVPTIAACCNVSWSGLNESSPNEIRYSSDYIAQLDAWNFAMTVKAGMIAILVAEDEFGQINGVVTGGKAMGRMSGYDAEIFACHVFHTMDSILDSILVMEMAKHLQTQGFKSVIVWINDTEALQTQYEHLGGQIVHTKTVYPHQHTLKQVGYGWKNINTLLENLGAYDVWHSK